MKSLFYLSQKNKLLKTKTKKKKETNLEYFILFQQKM